MPGLSKRRDDDAPPQQMAERPVAPAENMDHSLRDRSDRKLRNQLILANVAAWIAIGFAVHYFFF